MPAVLASTAVRSGMFLRNSPASMSTVASRGIGYISRPERQHAAGSVSAAVTGSSFGGRGWTARAGRATRSLKPPTRTHFAHWLIRPIAQSRHSPQPYEGSHATARPTIDFATPRPTSVTTPVYS